MKPVYMWCITQKYTERKGRFLMWYYLDNTRSGAIKKVKENLWNKYTWPQLKRRGFTVVKVELVQVKK